MAAAVLPIKTPQSIAIVSINMGGQGDLATGHHISTIARAAFPRLDTVFCQIKDPWIEDASKLFPHLSFKHSSGWGDVPIDNVFERIERRTLRGVIINSFVGDNLIPQEILNSKIPLFRLSEYGCYCK